MLAAMVGSQPVARSPHPQPEHILLVGTDSTTASCSTATLEDFRIACVSSCDAARRLILQGSPAALVTELVLPDGAGADLCRAVKALSRPSIVLVTTSDTTLVPDAIDAGCDGVLVKPFSPNLLFARLGRLLRLRSGVKTHRATSNDYWPDRACPHCRHQGVISFDFTSHRKAWYTCLACRKVWIGRRHD